MSSKSIYKHDSNSELFDILSAAVEWEAFRVDNDATKAPENNPNVLEDSLYEVFARAADPERYTKDDKFEELFGVAIQTLADLNPMQSRDKGDVIRALYPVIKAHPRNLNPWARLRDGKVKGDVEPSLLKFRT